MAMKSFNLSKSLNMSLDMSPGNISSFSMARELMSTMKSHSVEPFGSSVPSMVKIAIAGSTDQKYVTCRLDENGWAWLVHCKSLFIWRHGADTSKKSSVTCKELQLAPSELVHNAGLVCVFGSASSHTVSAIAINPEGLIQYWPNIQNASYIITTNADVPGQECDSLKSIWPMGFVVTTTTGTVLFLKIVTGRNNKTTITCQSIAATQHWLEGGWKRMTNILFTPMAAHSSAMDMRRAKVFFPPQSDAEVDSNIIYVLTGPSLQKWDISHNSISCIFDISIDDFIRKEFFQNVWCTNETQTTDVRAIQVWTLDVACVPESDSIALFAAAKSQIEDFQCLVFGILILKIERKRIRKEETKFYRIDFQFSPEIFSVEDEEHLVSFPWKIHITQKCVYIVSRRIALMYSDSESVKLDYIESESAGGIFLGSGILKDQVIICTSTKDLIYLKPVSATMLSNYEFSNDVRVPAHLSMSIAAHNSSLDSSDDELNQYKSAFFDFCTKKHEACEKMLKFLFPINVANRAPNDPVDILTVNLAENIINDKPLADPRFFRGKRDLDIKQKILIKNFLTNKREVLDLFFRFLHKVGIFNRLSGIVIGDAVQATASVLYNCYEKIGFAIALQTLHSGEYRQTIDLAVKSMVTQRLEDDHMSGATNLNASDLFYKEVNRIEDIIEQLVIQLESSAGVLEALKVPKLVIQISEILLKCVNDSFSECGTDKEVIFATMIQPLLESGTSQSQVIPWLVAPKTLEALCKLHRLNATYGFDKCEDNEEDRSTILSLMRQLADLILYNLKISIESIHNTERYAQKYSHFGQVRSSLLSSHLEIRDFEGGSALAEKYVDFNSLVTICYELDNMAKLEEFFDKYEDSGFCEFAFEWHIKSGRSKELIELFSRSIISEKLEAYLQDYPKLQWHYYTHCEEYEKASKCLELLGGMEEDLLKDKKLYMCLSKLSSLASGVEESKEQNVRLERDLELIGLQEAVPTVCLKAVGMEKDSMRVLSPSELIDIYTNDEVKTEPEFYLQALKVSDFLENDELRMEKRFLIATRAIKKDPWNEWKTEHPLDLVQKSMLHRYITLCLQLGYELEQIVNISVLLNEPVLEDILSSPDATYLLRACLEDVSDVSAQ